MNKKTKKIIIIAVICILVGIIVVIVINTKKDPYIEKVNTELNAEEFQFLLKKMVESLQKSDNIATNTSYTDNEKAHFAYLYTAYFDKSGEYTKLDEENSLGIVNEVKLKENVKYIFNNDLDMSNVTYESKEGYIYIPINLQGGDAKVYRYVSTTYDEQSSTYIASIDVLEPTSYEEAMRLLDGKKYDRENALFTLQIKYKVVEGRRILLAYTAI